MTTTNFTSGTVVESSWLNDVDRTVYEYADVPIARIKRLIVGFDEDTDLTNNASALSNNMLLIRYRTSYVENETPNSIQVQRYIGSDTGERGASFKASIVLGTEDPEGTPAFGAYAAEWGVNIELDNYSTQDIGAASVGVSSTIRRYSTQQVLGMHCNAMDMRVPDTATDADMGGITGMEAHSDAIGPDHRTGNNGYGFRTTIRCTARTQTTQPTWVKRGTGTMANGQTVSVDDICLPKDATLTTSYIGPYFVCVDGGVLGGVDTILDAETTPLAQVVDGGAIWECRVGTEVGIGLIIKNGSDNGVGQERPGYYRYGVIVENNANDGNLNEIAHAIYVLNNGEANFESYGDPDWHALLTGVAATGNLGLGSELTTGNTAKISFFGDDSSGARTIYSSLTTTILDDTVGMEDGRLTIAATSGGTGETHVYLEGKNTIIGEKAIIDTTAVSGFLHIGRCAGAPTGVPNLYTGKCPLVVDSTNGRFYVYHTGAWHYATLT